MTAGGDTCAAGQNSASPMLSAARDASALVFLAFVLNLVRIGTTSIELDEAISIRYAGLSAVSLLHSVTGVNPNMGLYYALLNVWVRLFGESEAAVRFPSALFGAFAVGALYLLGRRLFGRTVGLLAGLLLALNVFMVQYAQTARSYSLLVLLVTLSSLALAREIDRPSRFNRIGYAVVSVLAVYAQYFAVYCLAAHLVIIVVLKRRSALTREWLGVAAAIVLSCAPALSFVYRSGAGRRISWIGTPILRDVVGLFDSFTGGSAVLSCALLAGGCYGAALGWWQRRFWPHGFVAAWLFVPVVLSFLVSLAKPMFVSYYLILCLPALLLFGAAGIVRIRPPVVAGALVVLLVWISATRLVVFYEKKDRENWREGTRYVLNSTRSDDGVVFFPDFVATPFGYYARRNEMSEPPNVGGKPLAGKERIWLVIRESDAAADPPRFLQVQSSLRERFRLAEQRPFGGVRVELYEAKK